MYATAVKMALAHEEEIAQAAAKLIKTRGIEFYAKISQEELAIRVRPAFHLRLRYLETSDLTEWKQYCIDLTNQRGAEGVVYTSIIAAGDCINDAMMEFFRAELPKLEQIEGFSGKRVLQNLERRMQGLTAVGDSVVVGTGIKQQKNSKKV